jgi:hypothetical protein
VREDGKGWTGKKEGKERRKNRRELPVTYDPT